jgi:hypothetical protein
MTGKSGVAYKIVLSIVKSTEAIQYADEKN